MDNNPLRIYCKNCGAPAGFDIIHQTYRCPHCSQTSGIEEIKDGVLKWRKLSGQNKQERFGGRVIEECSCPTCGARMIFGEGEASETCDFCGTKLVRKELSSAEQLPDLIIPYFLTPQEAKNRLLAWAHKHSLTKEGRGILATIDRVQSYYLPYQLVRGPVEATAERDDTRRKFNCRGYLEGAAVNTSKQLDNLVLNEIEPFDWSKAEKFEYAFIAGHKVKLCDISDAEVHDRVIKETEADFERPVQKVLQTPDALVKIDGSDLASVTVLLPVYFIKFGALTAAVNGQTGRVAVTKDRYKRSYPWAIEPAIYTILATAILSYFYSFALEAVCLFGAVFACIFFCAMCDGHMTLMRRIVRRSKESRASRQSGELVIEEGNKILKNPFDNTPVFVEPDKDGQYVPVKIKFYSLYRFVSMAVKMFVLIFLPAFIAAPIHLAQIANTGEKFWDNFNVGYGAAWYIIAVFICILYWIRGMRRDIYEHPIIYKIKENGHKKLMGTRASRKCGILYMFGIGEPDKNGKIETLWDMFKEMPGFVLGALAIIGVFIFGCVAAMVF